MINAYTQYVRYNPTGDVVRVSREGYQGMYLYINNREVLVPMYNLREL